MTCQKQIFLSPSSRVGFNKENMVSLPYSFLVCTKLFSLVRSGSDERSALWRGVWPANLAERAESNKYKMRRLQENTMALFPKCLRLVNINRVGTKLEKQWVNTKTAALQPHSYAPAEVYQPLQTFQ